MFGSLTQHLSIYQCNYINFSFGSQLENHNLVGEPAYKCKTVQAYCSGLKARKKSPLWLFPKYSGASQDERLSPAGKPLLL